MAFGLIQETRQERSSEKIIPGSTRKTETYQLKKIEISKIVFILCTVLMTCIIIFVVGFIFYTAMPTFQREGVGFILG